MQAEIGQEDQRRHLATVSCCALDHQTTSQLPAASSRKLPSVTNWFSYFLLLFCAVAFSGCARLRLPAIDPNGSSIFLPLPNTTGLAGHNGQAWGQNGIIPTPAFTTPPAPPPCLDAKNGGVCNLFGGDKHRVVSKLQNHFDRRGKAGEIQLTPMRVVAPVGGEVVLLAGICGPDGYLVNREPLEWMLSPDSVGTFIEVGDDKLGTLTSLFHRTPKIEKLDVDFARGRTSSKRTVITRGTPNCNDDIELREGQTWLSVSSPSEGVSRITVLAPDSEIWDRRRLTSTIYWVDAQWEFPAPQIERTGEPISLTTHVTKAENLVPAEGWIVEYTILDPSIAVFDPPTGSNKAQVRVTRDGLAQVNIRSTPEGRGTTPVIIDVVRPADPSDNLPELVIGRGQTTVTFSSPGLNLEAFGPSVGTIGEQLTYSAMVGNPGDIQAENVQLRFQIPAGTRYVAANLQPTTQTPEYLIWDQGILPPNQQLNIDVVIEARQPATIAALFEARGQGFPNRERRIVTEITQASVDVRFAPEGNVAQAEVGDLVDYEIDVTNNGRQTITNLKLEIESDPGLPEHFQGENRVEQIIPTLQPGETRNIGVKFRVQQQGQLAARLRVSAGENVLAEKVTSIRGLPPAPKEPNIGVSIQFPETIRAGGKNTAVVTVRNSGETKLTGIQVQVSIDPSLYATQVDTTNATRIAMGPNDRLLTWSPQDILPRSSGSVGDPVRQLFIEFESRAQVEQGQLAVRAVSAENVQSDDSRTFRSIGVEVTPPVLPGQGGSPNQPGAPNNGGSPGSVLPDNTAPPVTPPANARAGGEIIPPRAGGARSGQLKVELEDYDDPTIVGRELRFNLFVFNDRPVSDREVNVLLRVPEGVQFKSMTRLTPNGGGAGTPVDYRFLEDGSISLPIIEAIRPGEQIIYFFVVVPQVPQLMEMASQVYSAGQPVPFVVTEQTTVNSR